MKTALDRRAFCKTVAVGCPALLAGAGAAGAEPAPPARTRVGLVTYCLGLHQKAPPELREGKDLSDPLTFLEESHRLGAGGIQAPLGAREPGYLDRLRRRAEALEMRVEAILDCPREPAEVERFERQVLAAKAAGAELARTAIMPGRRYEQFASLAEFRRAAQRGLRSLQLAEPVLARHRFRLAVENHKDHRIAERLELLRQLSSEYIGLCLDFGNNFALLEDPLEVARAFAPWTFTVHLKDQALGEYEQGFLFADAALGQGFLPLAEMVRALQQVRPGVPFDLEVITRDPLKVPVLTDQFWAALPDVPARDLARALRAVKSKNFPAALALVSHLPPARQLARERSNILQSLAYARERLAL